MQVTGPSGVNPVRSTGVRNVAPPREVERRSAPTAAQVNVSSAASQMAESRGPEVLDQARIEQLRQAIQDNALPIDPNAIAERMMAEEA